MQGLEIRPITVVNLPDLVVPGMMRGALGSRLTLPADIAEEMTRHKLAFFHDRMRHGAAAMAAYRHGRPIGVLEYYPIELAPAPVIGSDIYVVHSLTVVDDEMREEVEKELVGACVNDWSTRNGVAVLARSRPFDTLGFEEVARDMWPEGDELVLWLMKFREVEDPTIAPLNIKIPKLNGRVRIDLFDSGSDPWMLYLGTVLEQVAEEFSPHVVVEKTDVGARDRVLHYGLADGIALNGKFHAWLPPHPIPGIKEIRELVDLLI